MSDETQHGDGNGNEEEVNDGSEGGTGIDPNGGEDAKSSVYTETDTDDGGD